VAEDPGAVARGLTSSTAEAVLLLGGELALPAADELARLLAGPADAWHGGLRLGLEGQPSLLDHVAPLWMLNARLDPDREATSWRLSLRATLVRRSVVDQLGGPDPGFATLTGAGLDLGMRWIRAGALVRHVPDLVPAPGAGADTPPPVADGLRLIGRHHGRTWAGWALQRAVLGREVGPVRAARLVGEVRHARTEPLPPFRPEPRPEGATDRRITVVLPTVDRYPTLVPLLGQLAAQTAPPHEVIVVDQTEPARRRHDLEEVAPDLPVHVIGLDQPGQSTARNAALQCATGDVALFIDDDDEIPPTLLADHLRLLGDGIDAVCGAVDDATAGPPPPGFRHRRASDVFPTNNATVRMSALARSGLFDPAYDHGPRADHDLGMRLHLSGAVLVYDPSVEVHHLHAPSGGLRTHGARKVTRASARRSLTQRDLPSVTQQYLAHRYFDARQRREDRAISAASSLSGEGTTLRRLARALLQLVRLPSTVRTLDRTDREAAARLADRPEIPSLPSGQDRHDR
jgi:GT2 family glycosyltransferase